MKKTGLELEYQTMGKWLVRVLWYVGWLRGNDSNSSVIKQYSLEDQLKEQCKPDKGDLQFAKAAPIMVLKEKVIYLAFQLQFPHPLA